MSFLDIERVRSDFPALQVQVYGKPVVYFDSAATSLKPTPVIEAISEYYSTINSNVHRGSYRFSQMASDAFDSVRHQIKEFLNAANTNEIIFTKGATEGINMVAFGLSHQIVEGDEVLISMMEHHSNMIPWQMLCKQTGATLKLIPVDSRGDLDMDAFRSLLNEHTKILAITHISNVLGTINPVKWMAAQAHEYGAMVVIDGAQGIVHGPADVRDMNCDFYCFSAHKVYGPMGVGVLYGKKEMLEKLRPSEYGGGMADHVNALTSGYKLLPQRLEAGTPNVSGVIGMGAGIHYLEHLGWDFIESSERILGDYMRDQLMRLDFIHIFGNSRGKAPIYSMSVDNIHAYDLGTLLDKFGIACRTGFHCAQVLHDQAGLKGSLRASLAFFNTQEEIDIFVDALRKIKTMLS